MVGTAVVASDVLQTVLFLAIPPALWLLLWRLAWADPALARASGFTRPIFWLLLPGALIGSYANLPFFPWNGDVLAIDIGGALIPLVVSAWLLARAFGRRALLWAAFFLLFAGECGVAFGGEFLLGTGLDYALFLTATCAGFVVLAFVLALLGGDENRPTLGQVARLLILTDAALIPTFLTTQSVPGFGIVSLFPYYLAVPLAMGAAVAALTRPMLGRPGCVGMGIAYAVTTFGVVIGADLLREPPLYGSSGFILSIGGAGTNDLVFLSGLIAAAAALITLRIARLRPEDVGTWAPSYVAAEAPSPPAILRRSLRRAVDGAPADSLALSQQAVEAAEAQAHRLVGAPSPEGPGTWYGLPAPAWMVADRRNLAALASSSTAAPRDSTRGWIMARWLVRFLTEVSLHRFATFWRRAGAFIVDLVVVTVPGLIVWYAIAASFSGSSTDLLSSIPLNAAVFLDAAGAFLYFVLAEGITGTTVGKLAFGLEVKDRTLGAPDGIAVLLRNLPKLIPLTLLAVGLAAAVSLFVRGLPAGSSSLLGIDEATGVFVLISVGGVGIPGLVSLAVINASPERQRIGDWFAGTWVVRSVRQGRQRKAPAGSGPSG